MIHPSIPDRLVLESIMKLEDDRKCWRLVNGVLFEKMNSEVKPELKQMIGNLATVVKQLQEAILLKKQESAQLEMAYDSIMKQAKAQKQETDDREVKSGGVLV
jgi:chaperonin cofactor prefoldin